MPRPSAPARSRSPPTPGSGTPPGAATPGQLTFGGGTLQATASFTLNANRGVALGAGGGTFDVSSSRTLTYGGAATGTGGLTKTSAGALDLSGGSVTAGSVTLSGGTLSAPSSGAFNVTGAWTNNASAGALVPGGGTVTLNGSSSQAIGGSFATTFSGLTISNASGITLGVDETASGLLTFTSRAITTGSNTLHLGAGGSVSRTSGHVVGNFEKHIPTGSPTRTFEVGDTTRYTPVTVAFASVTGAGTLTASTTLGDQPQLGTSTINPALSVNRYWMLTGSGIVFTTYNATFTFVPGDLDVGVDTNHLNVESYVPSTWTSYAIGTRTSTSTQATGNSGFGDFAVGELAGGALDHFVVSAPGSTVAGSAVNVTVVAVDSVGNVVTGYTGTVTFSSTDIYAVFSPSSYTFLRGRGDQDVRRRRHFEGRGDPDRHRL